MSDIDEHPFGESNYKNYDPEQVNTAEDVVELFEWIAEQNKEKGSPTAADVFKECAGVVDDVLVGEDPDA